MQCNGCWSICDWMSEWACVLTDLIEAKAIVNLYHHERRRNRILFSSQRQKISPFLSHLLFFHIVVFLSLFIKESSHCMHHTVGSFWLYIFLGSIRFEATRTIARLLWAETDNERERGHECLMCNWMRFHVPIYGFSYCNGTFRTIIIIHRKKRMCIYTHTHAHTSTGLQ